MAAAAVCFLQREVYTMCVEYLTREWYVKRQTSFALRKWLNFLIMSYILPFINHHLMDFGGTQAITVNKEYKERHVSFCVAFYKTALAQKSSGSL